MSEIAGDAFFLGLLFKIFSREHIHPPYSGGVHTTRTHPINALRLGKYQITKSQAFETKYYGHPSCYDLKIPEKYTKTIVYNHSADCPNLSAAKY